MRDLYTSTGTLVGHSNGFNYRRALCEIAGLVDRGFTDGLELMMLKFYYDKIDDVAEAVRQSGVKPAVIHCEKDVGTMISDAGILAHDGKTDEAEALYRDAEELFRLNCVMAEKLAIPRMVLHLWGGISSDAHIEYNISKMARLNEIAASYGTRILCENIPSNHADPHTNWKKLLPHLGNAGLIFDTRFGKLHEQTREILTDSAVTEKLEHVHISDFGGTYRDFRALRPILHPGEGTIDFSEAAELLNGIGYTGTITLESPVMEGEDVNIPKIEKTLAYLRKTFC
ncbi:MAG: sugar phosphate isomerase/epimerase [Clostridia bacterium]|nr:sugar phosphate isomerase/epimerase [Clostridia bacterium]MBQ8333124.1 sugar phosphate isomerase/epimerase [Clostridia bacterium]MBQ8371216.1 sugar phosphate isomerase/epimerase [Clostridia bacterium]MBQ8511234.1 sugar phosphate isomerase/epimerase [Clostridia bacterium]